MPFATVKRVSRARLVVLQVVLSWLNRDAMPVQPPLVLRPSFESSDESSAIGASPHYLPALGLLSAPALSLPINAA